MNHVTLSADWDSKADSTAGRVVSERPAVARIYDEEETKK
jgi:hypothetical protein